MDNARCFQDRTTDHGALLRKVAARMRGILPAFALVSGIMLLPQISTATTIVTTSAEVSGTHISGSLDTDQATGAAGQSAQANSSAASSVALPPLGTQTGGATANGSAVEGALHASASSNSLTAGIIQNSASGTSSASAAWSDFLTVNAGSALFNTPGLVTATLDVSGAFGGLLGGPVGGAVLTEASVFSVFVQIFGTGMAGDPACPGVAYCGEQRSSSGHLFGGPQHFVDAMPSVIILNIPVTFGSAVTLGYHLEVRAQSVTLTGGDGVGTSASSFADFSNSVLWSGITGVFDVNGAAVENFTTASASGFDYGQAEPAAVPEPITLSLVGIGLGGMAWLRRRARLTPRINS